MFIIIAIMLGGMGIGFLLRRHKLKGIGHAITALIWVLLFLLGLEVGNNDRIISGLHNLGLEAIAITVAAVAGSSVAAWALWRMVSTSSSRRKEEHRP